MLLGSTNFLHRSVRDREVDFPRGRASLCGRETQTTEERLRDTMMSPILEQGSLPLLGQPALAPMPFHQPQLLQGSQVAERGRGAELECCGDALERGSTFRRLARADGPECIELPPRELLECLHSPHQVVGQYIGHPNY